MWKINGIDFASEIEYPEVKIYKISKIDDEDFYSKIIQFFMEILIMEISLVKFYRWEFYSEYICFKEARWDQSEPLSHESANDGLLKLPVMKAEVAHA